MVGRWAVQCGTLSLSDVLAAADLETISARLVNFPSVKSNAYRMNPPLFIYLTILTRLYTLAARQPNAGLLRGGKEINKACAQLQFFRSAPQTFLHLSVRLQMTNRPRSSSADCVGPAVTAFRPPEVSPAAVSVC